MSEEEKAIKWLEITKNYKLKSEELHYILVLFNLIINLKRENQKLKEQLKIKHDGFMASVDESCEYAEENQKYKEVINELRNYLKARIEVCDNRLSIPFCNFEKTTKERLILSQCLEKLEELEVKDK